MNIYTAELTQRLQRKFRMNPHGDKNSLYSFVCSPQLKPVRDRIERWIDEFPELTANRDFISRFTLQPSHRHAISELVTGIALKRFGFEVKYNKSFGGQTPDWYAHGKAGIPNFVVEVTTINPPSSNQAVINKIGAFFNSIRKLGIGVTLKITMIDENAGSNFRLSQKKKSVESIETWLKTIPSVGAKHHVAGFQFEIHEWKEGTSLLTTKGPGRSFHINPTLFADVIRRKIEKYESMIETHGLPFIVALQTDDRVGLNLKYLKQILSGERQTLSIAESKLPVEKIKHILSQNNKGLFGRLPLLSGVLWIECDYYRTAWNLLPLYNPLAKHKLLSNALSKIWFL